MFVPPVTNMSFILCATRGLVAKTNTHLLLMGVHIKKVDSLYGWYCAQQVHAVL